MLWENGDKLTDKEKADLILWGMKKTNKGSADLRRKGFEIVENDFIEYAILDCDKMLSQLKEHPEYYADVSLKKPLELWLNYLQAKKDGNPAKQFASLPNDKVMEYINPHHLEKFKAVEYDLLQRGYLNENYIWGKAKKELIDLLTLLYSKDYFKRVVNGKRTQYIHCRQFLAQRYYGNNKALTYSGQKHKPTLEQAETTFCLFQI